MTRTIGRHAPKYLPPDEVVETCDYCGTPWLRSKLRKDRSGLWYCPNEGEGRDKTALNRANARALQRGLRPSKPVSGRKPLYKPQPLDNVSVAPVAAWSVSHRLRSAYVSDLLRIRVGTTETDISYGDYDALDTDAIETAAGSSVAYVSKIYDQSGNARHLTQTTESAQPQIFDGTSIHTIGTEEVPCWFRTATGKQYLERSDILGFSGTQPLSIFLVVQNTTTAGNDDFFTIGHGANDAIVARHASTAGFHFLVASPFAFLTMVATSPYARTSAESLVMRYDGGTWDNENAINCNGAFPPVTGTASVPTIPSGWDKTRLGSGFSSVGGADNQPMRVNTCVVWDEEITNEDVATLVEWSQRVIGIARARL